MDFPFSSVWAATWINTNDGCSFVERRSAKTNRNCVVNVIEKHANDSWRCVRENYTNDDSTPSFYYRILDLEE
jgi:hypothetical protein